MAYKLPVTIATKTQLVNVYENLRSVLEKGIQNSIRADEGVDFEDLPEVSSALAVIIKENKIKVDNQSLKKLETWLGDLKHTAPIVRFTFASDPDNEAVVRIVKWLRDESGREVLVRVGVQPTIAAGCIVHTPSHQYDFSLRNHLLENVSLFTQILNEKIAAAPPEPVVETVVAQ